MKKKSLAAVMALCLFALSGCGAETTSAPAAEATETQAEETTIAVVKKDIELELGQELSLEDSELSEYDNIMWSSDNEDIVSIEKNKAVGADIGNAKVIGKCDGQDIAEYNITVNVVDITAVLLSENSTEITIGDDYQVKYTLIPENASDYGITWTSANTDIATVDDKGNVLAINEGETTILLSTANGIIEKLSVTVKQKPAYDRLSDHEKDLVDKFLPYIKHFKNPDSVTIKEVSKTIKGYKVKVAAQNGFGGMGFQTYALCDEEGLIALDKLEGQEWVDNYKTDDSFTGEFDIDLINEAINEKR